MKSAYELAMERLNAEDGPSKSLSEAQKEQLADIDRRYQAKIAEKELFLRQKLEAAQREHNAEAVEALEIQLRSERALLEEDREAQKERVRGSNS